MSLQYYIANLSQFGIDLPDLIKEIVKGKEAFIVNLVKNRLYQTGKNGSGQLILPSYALSTIRDKKRRNKRTSHVTLRNEGLFYKGFYLELERYNIILNSSDNKTSWLIDKYGPTILKFTAEKKTLILDTIIEPTILKKINELNFNTGSSSGIKIDTF